MLFFDFCEEIEVCLAQPFDLSLHVYGLLLECLDELFEQTPRMPSIGKVSGLQSMFNDGHKVLLRRFPHLHNFLDMCVFALRLHHQAHDNLKHAYYLPNPLFLAKSNKVNARSVQKLVMDDLKVLFNLLHKLQHVEQSVEPLSGIGLQIHGEIEVGVIDGS